MVTKQGADEVWSYPNIHGDVVATADDSGAKQGATLSYDPDGNTATVPDNATGAFDYGWLGQHQRPLEHQNGLLDTVEMGARQYLPSLGRFLEVDPIEQGSANEYDYVSGDPLNGLDLDGRLAVTYHMVVHGIFYGDWWDGFSICGGWGAGMCFQHVGVFKIFVLAYYKTARSGHHIYGLYSYTYSVYKVTWAVTLGPFGFPDFNSVDPALSRGGQALLRVSTCDRVGMSGLRFRCVPRDVGQYERSLVYPRSRLELLKRLLLMVGGWGKREWR